MFTVPGESFLAALDGLHDSNRIKTVICRQEGGASMMAEAWGKITGEPGICFVTRGPGAANAMSGLHVAQQDSTPMVIFVGMPARDTEDREAFQEIEIKQLFASLREVGGRDPRHRPHPRVREPRLSRRPVRPTGPRGAGPAGGHAGRRMRGAGRQTARIAEAWPGAADIATLQERLAKAPASADDRRRAGLERRHAEGGRGLCRPLRSARRAGLPLPGLPRQPPSRYVGCAGIGTDPKLAAAISDADLLIVVGARLGEMTTAGYTLLGIPNPAPFLVHVHPSPDELGSVYRADLPIAASARAFGEALATCSRRPRSPGAAVGPSCALPTSRA